MLSCDGKFGPRVDTACRSFDFTLYFEDVVLSAVPNSIFILLAIISSIVLLRQQGIVKSSTLLGVKLAVFSILFVFQATFLGLRAKNEVLNTSASTAADALSLIATCAAVALSWLQHHRSEQPSTTLTLYLSALVLLDVARVRTLWLIPESSAAASMRTIALLLTAAVLVLESTGKRASLRQPEKLAHSGPEPFIGFWGITGYVWVLGTLSRGYRNYLCVEDLPELDYRISADRLHKELQSNLKKANLFKKNAFVAACGRAFAWSFISAVIPRLFLIGFKFAQPFMINNVLEFIGNKNAPQNIGNGLIGAYALVYAGMAISMALYRYYSNRFIIRLRGGLISVIYQQTVAARGIDLGDNVDGLALMGADVERISSSFRTIHEIWAAPIEIIISVYLLERQIAVACIVPGLLVLSFVCATFFIASLAKKYQRAWIEKVEERLRLTTNMLANMRTVKMLGLSSSMFSVIYKAREVEIENSTRYRWTLIGQIFFSNSPLMFAPVVTFIVFVAIANARHDNSFLAAKAFTSLSLIALLTEPTLMFIQAIPSVYECLSSFDRMQEYYRQPVHPGLLSRDDEASVTENKTSEISLHTLHGQMAAPGEPIVTFLDQNFAWEKSGPAVLHNLNASILKGRFTVIVGRTGSGKSTLLESILGETMDLGGRTERKFASAAYCSQVPWLVNGSLKSNITYGLSDAVDEAWYETVVAACGLENDINSLAGGDLAEIGNGGGKLSGGQRQRLSLARAVYSREQVILLDDVFSGVDNANIAHISESLFGSDGLLRRNGSTVVLVTHSKYLMMMADDVLVVDQGRIVESRTVASLQSRDGFSSGFQIEESTDDTEDESVKETKPANLHALSRAATVDDTISALNEEAADLKRKHGAPSVYRYYMYSSGVFKVITMLVTGGLYIFCSEFGVVWIDLWSAANARNPGHANNDMYLGVYAGLGVFSGVILLFLCWLVFVNMISASSRNLHTDLLTAVIRASLLFYQETDLGSITNRFSQDMELIGIELPIIIINYLASFYECIAKVLLLAVFGRYLTASLPIFLAAIYIIQRIYLRTSRQVRLLDIEAKAPVYLQFLESKNGAATLRAFGWQQSCQLALQGLLNRSQRPVYLLFCIQQWLALVLDAMVSALVLILIAIVVTWRDKFSPGSVGVSLVTVMTFNSALTQLIKMWTSLETSIGAVGRIKDFKDNTVPEEEVLGILQPESPPPNWPRVGNIEFKNVVASYKETGPSVLKGLTLSIKAGEKVAICGRSGSGKTSLILSLLHLIHLNGKLEIDGVDIHNLVPNELRALINIVPQEPFLMPGSVRQNVDPFETARDEDIIAALKRLELWERIEAAGGINSEMPLTAWSVGERQLICMARAMVRRSPILILDEATSRSSVDHKTEEIMQQVLETEFAGKTVLSVVHRLGYIERYDKVGVLQKGELMEFDAPATLLAQSSSILAAMKRAGTRRASSDRASKRKAQLRPVPPPPSSPSPSPTIVSFGYPVGDLIAGANLTYKLVRIMSDTRGASDEYVQAMSEVSAMQQAFMQVGHIRTHKLLPPATVNATSHIVISSLDIITAFLKKTEGYHSMLENGSTVSGSQELLELRDALRSRLIVTPLLSSTTTYRVVDYDTDSASTSTAEPMLASDDRSDKLSETASSFIKKPTSIQSLWTAADALNSKKNWAEAEAIYLQMLDLDLTDFRWMQSNLKLGRALLEQRKYEEAESVFERALTFGEKELGKAHLDTIKAREGLAATFFRAEKLREGGKHIPKLLRSRSLDRQGKYAEAEALYRDAIVVQTRVLGAEHKVTIQTMSRLAFTLTRLGRDAEAEELTREALKLSTNGWGPNYKWALRKIRDLGMIVHRQKRYEEAEHTSRLGVERMAALHGSVVDECGDFLELLHNIARDIYEQGEHRHDESEELYPRVWESGRKYLGADHWITLDGVGRLGRLLLDAGRLGEAQPMLSDTLMRRRVLLKEEDPRLRASVKDEAEVWEKLKLRDGIGGRRGLATVVEEDMEEDLYNGSLKYNDSDSARVEGE
ncbi:ABC transporter, transmembrane domain, type 1 [Cordyceps fumosorosea ARSEF 2679]|uniref:ABC transporter, transmembrane domain, type 1 n=1 Tax=Cordyceps fumosorosea (strain ARSEF 2679) TaxID=1081104 RepID=A0A167T1H4_CORFA|nr:ABC transporter, transmembrane domain, type 1 [Cordyceps fumosorosea ARSEF 2679]OAA60152.1 ABC transporter, transmembrane domain, type 1 [Cordyceps fumosorosea ARSEF 2679]